MPLLLLCVVFQALSLSKGLNATDDGLSTSASKQADHPDEQIDLSALSLKDGCSGALRAFYQNTTVYVTLNLLDAQEKSKLALQICESLGCGHIHEHSTTASVHNGTCVADCILRDSKLHNCTTAAEGDCMNSTEVTCEHHIVRLVGGRDRCAGRVELLDSGNWGTVCDDDFNATVGNIICDQLKCGSAVRLGYFGAGTGAIHISKMNCSGSDRSLWDCILKNNTFGYCGHKEDAGIVCSESRESILPSSITEQLTTLAASTAVAAMEGSGGVSGAGIGCIILSIALIIFAVLNVAACLHYRKRKECVIHQRHSNSHASLENQSSELIDTYNSQIIPAAVYQHENFAQRVSSSYVSRTNEPPHNSDSSSDSDYEPHNRDPLRTLHLNNSARDMNDESSTCSGERYVHNVEINMDTIMSGDKAPLSSGAPYTHTAVDVNDSSSTSSGEFYENTKTDKDNVPRAEKPLLDEKSPFAVLSYGDCHLPGSENKVDVNDSSSTSSGECYQNLDDNINLLEKSPSMHERSYGDHQLPGTDSQVDVNDSESTSSGECYQNIDIDMDNPQSEDEESPSLPEPSVETPLTGNTAGYSGCRVPHAHTQDGNDSDSTSSDECYQNTEIDDKGFLHYDEGSPSFPETSFQNPHTAQMTESTDGYEDHHLPRSLSQETDNSSTASEASYVNVPPKNHTEDNSAASSDNDYDEVW